MNETIKAFEDKIKCLGFIGGEILLSDKDSIGFDYAYFYSLNITGTYLAVGIDSEHLVTFLRDENEGCAICIASHKIGLLESDDAVMEYLQWISNLAKVLINNKEKLN